MSNLTPPTHSLLALQTNKVNVSNPSIIHRRESEQSITASQAASEDYYSAYSLSGSHSSDEPGRSVATITRYATPPSRYRTPAHSRDNLTALPTTENSVGATALRGPGQRRQSGDSGSERGVPMPAPLHLRDGGIRRKPVPSTVIERPESSVASSPIQSRGTVVDERSNFNSPPTPGPHDEQYIRFALDQLTRDEDVRGSRRYDGLGSGRNGNYDYVRTSEHDSSAAPLQGQPGYGIQYTDHAAQPVQPLNAHHRNHSGEKLKELLGEDPQYGPDEHDQLLPETPPPRNPNRKSTPTFHPDSIDLKSVSAGGQQLHQPHGRSEADIFLPLAADATRPLSFVPGILRPAQIGLFIFLLLILLALLLFSASYSLTQTGLWNYGTFGDSRYFVFSYLPTLLGMVVLFWLFEVQKAVTRIAPFIAMASNTPRTRSEGPDLPLYQTGFLLPQLQCFRAGLPVLGVFQIVAWLQLFTIPLLAASHNVYFFSPTTPGVGTWRWIATQGAIWPVIALYLLLILTLLTLSIYLRNLRRRQETGLKWDPRSLADILVLLERSNALAEDAELSAETARLGLWRTQKRPQEVFHSFGLANTAPRRYNLQEGQIREKTAERASYERPETATSERRSKDPMLRSSGPRQQPSARFSTYSSEDSEALVAMPWFLRPVYTSLWVIIALVLLIAFLVVSYLPSTRVSAGFAPAVPAPVSKLGFSGTNFLYSFLPALLGEICVLLWLECDLGHRRMAPFLSLLPNKPSTADSEKGTREGELAERSLLLSYTADLPFVVAASALANGHWRVALLSLNTLIAATLPILGGGVFWAQFMIEQQRVLISTHMTAYYALTIFLVLFVLGWPLLLPFSAAERRLSHTSASSGANATATFADLLALVRHSRILDDVAFHAPASKTDLVTRLLSGLQTSPSGLHHAEAGQSKVSLADSVRGFGTARQKAMGGAQGMVMGGVPRYALGAFRGRDGREFGGLDRVRSA